MTTVGPAGESRLRSNLLASWLAHGVTLVIGFVMPRLIFDSVGPYALGVWDLAWSFISFFAYTGVGAASAVSHFVARWQAESDPGRVRRAISSSFYIQLGLGLLLGSAVTAAVGVLPAAVADLPPGGLRDNLPLIGFWTGCAVMLTIFGDTAQGVLNGSHRNDVNDLLGMIHDLVLAGLMAIVLLAGFNIVALAFCAALCRAAVEVAKLVQAVRICPEFNCRWSRFDLPVARAIVRFGAKSLASAMQELLTYQAARLVLFASMGAPALAVFSRYFTLTRQVPRLLDRLTLVVPPMASELASLGDYARLKRFTLRAAGLTVMVGLPLCVLLGVFGDYLVNLWMGPEFVAPGLAWVLAAMILLHIDRGVTTRVLSGMNAHGRISLVCSATSAVVFVVTLMWLYPLDPLKTAVLVAMTMVVGVSIPHFLLSCPKLRVGYLEYFLKVYSKPLIANIFFFLVLVGVRHVWDRGEQALAALVAVLALALLGALYWRVAFDEQMRRYVRRRLVFTGW